jgi:hypothetical protein
MISTQLIATGHAVNARVGALGGPRRIPKEPLERRPERERARGGGHLRARA